MEPTVLRRDMLRQAIASILHLAAAAAALSLPAQAALFSFDFEDQPPAGITDSQFSSRDITKDGLTASISRPNGTSFSFTNQIQPSPGSCLFNCAPSSWGARTLSPFVAESTNDYFTIQFSQLVSEVSIEAGDRNIDQDEAKLELYDSNRILLASTPLQSQDGSATIPGNILSFTLNRPANDIKSIRLYGGSTLGVDPKPNSLFWDNLSVRIIDPIVSPVPAPLPLLGAAAAFGFSRKIRHRIRSIS